MLKLVVLLCCIFVWVDLAGAKPRAKAAALKRPALLKTRVPLVLDPPVPPSSDLPMGTSSPDAVLPIQVLDGIVVGKPRREDFFLRSNGFVYLVRPHSPGLLKTIAGGDGVRVYGTVNGLNISNANVRVLQSRASTHWDDYAPPLPQ